MTMEREEMAIPLSILSEANLPLQKLPIPAHPNRENNKTAKGNTGWPRKSANLWMKEISINMNPTPSNENNAMDFSLFWLKYFLFSKCVSG